MIFLEVGRVRSPLYMNRFDPRWTGMFLVCTVQTFGDYRAGSRLQDDGCAGTLILFGLASWPQRALQTALWVMWTLFCRFLGWAINQAGLRFWLVHMECGRCAMEGSGAMHFCPSSQGELMILRVTTKPCFFSRWDFFFFLTFLGWLK